MSGSVANGQVADPQSLKIKDWDTKTTATAPLSEASAVTKAASEIAKDTSKKRGCGFKFALAVAAVMVAGSSPVGAVMIVALLAANELARDASKTSDRSNDSSSEQLNNASSSSTTPSSVEDLNKKRKEEQEEKRRRDTFLTNEQDLSGVEPKFGWGELGSPRSKGHRAFARQPISC